MRKDEIKNIKQIADRLPTVYEQTVSGFYEDYNEQGELGLFPNIVTHEINHTRRLRKAYEKMGLDGIKQYLDSIYKLVKQRNENIQNDKDNQRQDSAVELIYEDVQAGSVDSIPVSKDPLQAKK